MKDINKIILIGRLGADPIQRETKNGKSVVQFPLATSRRLKEASGGEESGESETTDSEKPGETTQWHRVVVWGRQGEACAQYLKKGAPVFVSGNLRSSKYQDKEGQTRMSFEVHAEEVSFLGSPVRFRDEASSQAAHAV